MEYNNLFIENIIAKANKNNHWNVILSSTLSALTVGGKALGKSLGVKKSNDIIYGLEKYFQYLQRKNSRYRLFFFSFKMVK